jgi:predicted RNA-binding protein
MSDTTETVPAAPTHWLLVSSQANFETSRARGFDIAGMKSRHRKKAETVKAGDTVFYYMVGIMAIGGISEVTGPYYEDDSHIWVSTRPDEEYPFRFPVKPVSIIESSDDFVRVEPLIDALEYPKRWPRKNWHLAFQGNVHKLNEHDYEIIASAVRSAAGDGGIK